MDLSLLGLLLIVPINFVLGTLVIYRDNKLKSNRYYSASILFICVWALGDAFLLSTDNPNIVMLAAQLFYIGPLFTALFLLLFSFHFLSSKISPKAKLTSWISTIITLALSVVIGVWPQYLIKDVSLGIDSNNSVVVNSTGWMIYTVFFSLYFLLSYIILFMKIRRASGAVKTQLEYVFVGIFLTSFSASITNLIYPSFGNTKLIWMGPVFTLFYVSATAMAILRHKLFDIRLFAVRAAAYTFTTIVLGMLYVAPLMLVLMKIMQLEFELSKFLLSVFVGTLAANNYQRLKNWFNRATSKVFFRDAYDPTEMVAELNRSLVGVIDIHKLLSETSAVIEKNIKPEACYFIVKNQNSESHAYRMIESRHTRQNEAVVASLLPLLESKLHANTVFTHLLDPASKLRAELSDRSIAVVLRLLPMGSRKDEALGYMVIGTRKSGKAYDLTDSQVLETVASTLIIAIQNALHFEEIQQFNVTLQQKVDEATRKLRATNEKLRLLDETKDEFISMASHQLRTPLTSVKGYLSMVLDGDAGKISKPQEELLKQSFLSSQRMVSLIADLLNLSRLNTGKFVIDATPVDLRDVISSEIMQLRETAKAKNIELVYDSPASFPALQLDETKTHQVVMNFIDNALYYTPVGGRVEVALSETPHHVEFRVKDNGIGVPREQQKHLFTKFYRAENAKRARPDGTGLGIFMAKKVVVAQGGAIIFESEEGKGSTFGFRFNKSKPKP